MMRFKAIYTTGFLLALSGIFALQGCSKKTEKIQSLAELHPELQAAKLADSIPEEKTEPPRYFYPYGSKRDPFTPLTGGPGGSLGTSAAGKGFERGDLSNLELKGILRDRKGKVAFISTADGEPFVLKSGRIYDRKNRIIAGVSGIIKESSVVLISQNRTMTELNLRKKETGTGASKSQ